ncbi:MAG: RNA pseudouridine synthase [Arcobacter sp.]|nr:MAG: RNA pseudouridine synthase [Arcobacter sp.]
MPYILKQFDVISGKKVEDFLVGIVKLPENLAFKLLQKGRIIDDKKKRLQKGYVLKSGFIEVSIYEAITKGLKPMFQTEHFAIFDKPSGLIVHPSARSTQYTLLDEIRFHFGDEASLVHRIDAETSGLVLVSKNKYSEMVLSAMFEEKKFIKKYKALVQNELKEEVLIDKNISNSKGLIKLKMQLSEDGKESLTKIKPILYDKTKNQTLVEATPYTGRQHQIRVHLDAINHTIVGDPIYGLDEKFVDNFLKGNISKEEREKITKEKRLMLHANYLEFTFLNRTYKFFSKSTL